MINTSGHFSRSGVEISRAVHDVCHCRHAGDFGQGGGAYACFELPNGGQARPLTVHGVGRLLPHFSLLSVAPIDDVQFDVVAATKGVDYRAEGHVDGARQVRQIVEPVAAPKGHAAERSAMLG